MADLTSFGIVSVSTALTRRFTLRKEVEEGNVALTAGGEFSHACTYGPKYMFDVEGNGDLQADFALAGSGPTIAGLTGGVTLVESTGKSQRMGNPNEWSASGEHAPDAS